MLYFMEHDHEIIVKCRWGCRGGLKLPSLGIESLKSFGLSTSEGPINSLK